MEWQRHVPLRDYTSLRLGGPADLFVEPETPQEAAEALRFCQTRGLPFFVLGAGSNLLVRDGGFRGCVIRIGPKMGRIDCAPDGTVRCGAGAMMSSVSLAAAKAGLAGFSFAAGIPGTMGGSVLMNAGAYGGEMSQVVTGVTALTPSGDIRALSAGELDFSYRHSALQGADLIVTAVTLRLTPGADPAALLEERRDINRRRAEKQPLEYPSAGSTFKRPEGHYAAQLIDGCGLKGCSVGGAQVSAKHAGFLLNRGGSSADFEALMRHVQTVVLEQTGVRLAPEVILIGEP